MATLKFSYLIQILINTQKNNILARHIFILININENVRSSFGNEKYGSRLISLVLIKGF